MPILLQRAVIKFWPIAVVVVLVAMPWTIKKAINELCQK